MADAEPLKTPLHGRHVAMEAKMGDEGGWQVPLSYRGALDEVEAAHRRAGVCDVSHVGRIRIRGDGALDLLERVCTADVARQEDDTARLTLLCNERGGIRDACLLLRLENFWVLTCSPCNRAKVLADLQAAAAGLDVKVDDQSPVTSQLAVVGPAAPAILDAILPVRVTGLARGEAKLGSLMVARYIAMRAGPTVLWSLEVILPNLFILPAWDFITHKAGANALGPLGTAARDVLRIEAGCVRWGHEIDETVDPITAGLGAAVDFGHDFIGAGAVRAVQQRGPGRKRVGLVLANEAQSQVAGVCRKGTVVRGPGGGEVGAVTSGTFSPAAGAVIAMAYVRCDVAAEGTEVAVGEAGVSARVSSLPFVGRTPPETGTDGGNGAS